MWKLLSCGLISALIVLSSPDQLLAQTGDQTGGRVIDVDVPAPALRGNLLNSPSTLSAAIYLPPNYDQQPDRSFPVVYLLHGIFDDYGVWIENFEVPSILDRLIAEGEIPELIMVMPNAGNRYGGGYYRNSPVSGNWADAIADNLVGFVDEQFRTFADVESRAVVGHSMGGYGALNLAMTRPEIFSVVWALSPCCLAVNDDLSFGNDAWQRAAAVTGPDALQDLMDDGDFYPIAVLGIVTAFSPDVEAPPIYGDFPFDTVRGEIILDDAAFDRFLDEFPVRQVREARENLRNMRGLALGVGLGDQFLHIPTGTLEFSQRLGAERIPHRLDVYAGDHRQHVGERLENIVFPWVAERLSVPE
ncbi:alpha/beta hydrolase [Rhodophyticola sp. CCM32]|uniref:alpha/beta hydrolase n=1 Tax=Rhodophyticola sp. CCM32 TaxID=2916397 RepID=UPI00143D6BB4|nr:alpha/beta fold hydrolase [Rhodophyticola sp. CCM32]